MKIAISGSTGFIGVHLIHHLLTTGHTVVAIKRETSSLDEFNLVKAYYQLESASYNDLQWVNCELYDPIGLEEALTGCDQVIHLAGFISYNSKDRDKLQKINYQYTRFLVNAALSAGLKQFIYLSSTAAIAKSAVDNDVKESNDWDSALPHSYYGLSKQLGELEVQRAEQEGLPITILNPGVVLGFGDWNKGSLQLFKNAYTKFAFYSNGITGFIGVKDVCKTINHFINESTGERYILVSENKSFRDIAFNMADGFSKKRPWVEVKGFLYSVIYALLSLKDTLRIKGMLSRETARSSVSVNRFNNSKLTAAIPFALTPIDEVIAESCAAYKQ